MRKTILSFIFLSLTTVLIWAALPATDGFDSGATLSASWTVDSGAFTVTGGSVGPTNTGGSTSYARWNADTFANDQYSEGVISGTLSDGGDRFAMVTVRAATGPDNYTYQTDSGTADNELQSIDNNSGTVLDECATTFAAADTIGIEAEGTTIRGTKNGSPVAGCSATDATFSSGSAGIGFYTGGTPAASLTSWEGGNIGAAPATERKRLIMIGFLSRPWVATHRNPRYQPVVRIERGMITVAHGLVLVNPIPLRYLWPKF